MSKYFEQRNLGGFSVFPPVLKWILVLNIVVFLFEHLFLRAFTETFGTIPFDRFFIGFLGLQPIGDGMNYFSFFPWQLITYQFMHGGIFHLIFNMFALWMFGAELEFLWGSKKFLIYYLLCGVGGGLVQIFIADAPTVGASAAVYGILLAFGLTFPNRPIFAFPIFIPIPAKYYVLIFAAIELLSGINNTSTSKVAHFAHLGGAATGMLLIVFGEKFGVFRFLENLFSRRKKKSFYEDDATVYKVNWGVKSESAHTESFIKSTFNPESSVKKKARLISSDGEEITQSKIDAILDKISSSGYQNLSDKEKNILTELSKKIK